MSQQDDIIGGVGIVRVGTLEITITPLSQKEESILDRRLWSAAEEAVGDHYTRCKKELNAALPHDRLEMVRELTRAADREEPITDRQFWKYRQSPPGVAIELFARGKKATPGLTQEGLAAVITAANVDEIAEEMFSIIRTGDPKATR